LRGKTVAVLVLTFKPDTGDMREAPSIPLVTGLLDMGARARAHDPVGMEQAPRPSRVVPVGTRRPRWVIASDSKASGGGFGPRVSGEAQASCKKQLKPRVSNSLMKTEEAECSFSKAQR
jgi:UDP-glucose/GDP-mannose dehydrogenase family, UDP binding domain